MRETKSKSILRIFIVAIFFMVMISPTVSSAEQDSRLLGITIIDIETAFVEWRIPYHGEALRYLQVARQVLQENIADVEEGNEQLFLQDVQNIKIAVDNQTLVITFNLVGNYSDGFITGEYRDLPELGEYAPGGIDVLTIKIPDGKYLSAITPGPNEMVGNELVYYNYNWIYPLEINYSDQVTTTQVGEEWELPTIKTISVRDVSAEKQTQGEVDILAVPTPISNFSFGINEDSKYTIPGYGSYVGTDTVPGTNGKTAYQIASDYKPKLYKDTGAFYLIKPGDGPDYGYYRVLKGKDPYTGFDAYLIQYIMYWNKQNCFLDSHVYDYEPIFIWVRNIDEKPYRVAYDRVTTWGADFHIYDIHRTYLWTEDPPISDGKYDLADMLSIYTQDKSYYPTGRHLYEADKDDDLWLHNISTSLPSESLKWDGTRVRLSHANCYNTFDTEFDLLEDPPEPYALIPLDDPQLRTWYTPPYTFDMDVADPFYEVFWEGVSMPEQKITTILNSATPDGNTLTVDANLYYTLDPNGSPLSYPLKGLHGDRFNAWLGSTLLSQSSITETSAGRYELNYDISSFTLGQTYTFKLTVKDNLDLLDSTNIKSVTIPGDSQPPIISPSAHPQSIPEDTDNNPTCAGTPYSEVSLLNVTVTDASGVLGVTVSLSAIGGLHDQPMSNVSDTWTVNTNASIGSAIYDGTAYLPHYLRVNATDIYGNSNSSISIPLTVIKNGDVNKDGDTTLYDAMYLARNVLGSPGFETINPGVAEVSGDCIKTLYDAMYLARNVLGSPGFETLK